MSEQDARQGRDPYPWLDWGTEQWRALWPSIGEAARRANEAAIAALGEGLGQQELARPGIRAAKGGRDRG